jgi:streptomycin 6-kinase
MAHLLSTMLGTMINGGSDERLPIAANRRSDGGLSSWDVVIEVPAELAAFHARFRGDEGREWIARLPGLAAQAFDRWALTLDGRMRHGMVGLVLPVRLKDGGNNEGGTAVLKLQHIDEEHLGEGTALRVWAGGGAVLLLDEHETDGTSMLLLERLDADRSLATVKEDDAVGVIKGLLTRLNAHQAPAGIRTLDDIVAKMLADVPEAVTKLVDSRERSLLIRWADAVNDLGPAGYRLLHWDLHYENVLAGEREPWLAIDPKPLAGDPGFDLLPALHNRWDEVVASGDVRSAVRRRFDQLSEGLDRDRAIAWTLARVLQNSLWTVEDGDVRLEEAQVAVAEALT